MADRVGEQLGNYRLTRLLGQGGFAEVYLGEHVYLKTPAALKVLDTELSEQDAASFVQEAQTLARLSHPHIVRVLDFAVEDGTPFLVIEYAPHGTLRQLHPKGNRLPLETIVLYVQQIAAALQYAHNQRLIHRDVKPENLLLNERFDILLSDFGLGMFARHTLSQSIQQVAGTAFYIAPEQIQGKPRPASDQYALGIVVYEWLTGDCPFGGPLTQIVTQHLAAPPPSLREQVPTLSPALEEVVLRALAKEPKQRFASVQDFATALQHAAQGTTSPHSTLLSTRAEPTSLSLTPPADVMQERSSFEAGILPTFVPLTPGRGPQDTVQKLDITDRLIASAANLTDEYVIPLLWKLRGEALAALHRSEEAETMLQAAQEAACTQGLQSLQWRICVSLAKLYQGQGRNKEAEQAFATARTIIEELANTLADESLRDNFTRLATRMFLSPSV